MPEAALALIWPIAMESDALMANSVRVGEDRPANSVDPVYRNGRLSAVITVLEGQLAELDRLGVTFGACDLDLAIVRLRSLIAR